MNNIGKIITAIAAGAATGAIAGILFAPDKGSETRKKINDQGKKIADGVKNKYQSVAGKCIDPNKNSEQKVKQTAEEFV